MFKSILECFSYTKCPQNDAKAENLIFICPVSRKGPKFATATGVRTYTKRVVRML